MARINKAAIARRRGTDVNIYRWNVDRFFEDMWDKLYSTLSAGAEDSVDTSKGFITVYEYSDVGPAPSKWDRAGFDSICVWQPAKEDLKFAESLAKKYDLDYEYKYDKYVDENPHALVIYVPAGADVDEYIDFEPAEYKEVMNNGQWKARNAAPKTAPKEVEVEVDSSFDDEVDEGLKFISKLYK